MTAKELARVIWPYINDDKRQRTVIAMSGPYIYSFSGPKMTDELFCQDAIHACFARLVEKHGLRKAFEMVNHALANEMLGTTGGKI